MMDKTVGEVSIRGNSKLVFGIAEWRGRVYASVRKFVATQKYEGPTKSGFIVDAPMLVELTSTLLRLERTLPPREENEFCQLRKNGSANLRIATIPAEQEDDLPSVDIREFVDSPSYQGPTKRGIRFPWTLLPDVIACMRAQANRLREENPGQQRLWSATDLTNVPDLSMDAYSFDDSPAGVLGEPLRPFPDDFLSVVPGDARLVKLPDSPLAIGKDALGDCCLNTEGRFFLKVRNQAEANFMIYAQMRGCLKILVPPEMIKIFTAVKQYENYVRGLQARLVSEFSKRTGQHSVSEYEAKRRCRSWGLPWLHT